MTRRLAHIPMLLLALACLVAPMRGLASDEAYLQELASKERSERHRTLLAHGINPAPAALLAFVERGFPNEAIARGLPREPAIKSNVVIAAIQELGFRRSTAAVPLLVATLDGEIPQGAANIIRRDVETLPVQIADQRYATFAMYLRYNALVALGLIGDPAAEKPIRDAMAREDADSFRVEGAIALGLLEKPGGIQALQALASGPRSDEMPGVFEAVFFLAGRNYGVTEQTSPARRRQVAKEFQDWVRGEGRNFQPTRAEILRRRSTGIVIPDPPVTSLRGALRGTRQFTDFDRRFAARQRLQEIAPASVPELRTIAIDPLEDLDIRLAAMDWYAATAGRDAVRDLDRLADNDEVTEIRQRAAVLVEEIGKLRRR